MRSACHAKEFFAALREILVAIGVNDGNMEDGSLRCDANVSVRPKGQAALGVKAEVKNLNSFRFLERAVAYEIRRQSDALTAGQRIVQETRLWDAEAGRTVAMRSKEEAHDYRYFPEPDLPPLQVSDAWVDEVRVAVPELPEARRSRLMTTHGLTRAQAVQLTQVRPGLAAYFEELVVAIGQVKPALNWTLSEVNRKMNELGTDDVEVVRARLLPTALAELLGLVERGIVNGTVAKEMFEKMYATGDAAEAIVEREGLAQIDDAGALEAVIRDVLTEHADAVAQYRSGKGGALSFLVGQVMRATQGKANPKLVHTLLRTAIED